MPNREEECRSAGPGRAGGCPMPRTRIERDPMGWKAFEAPGVEPVVPREKSGNREPRVLPLGEIRVLDAGGNVECESRSTSETHLLWIRTTDTKRLG